MQTIPPEDDQRTLKPHDWADLRFLQDELRKGTLDINKVGQKEIGLGIQMLFSECRRLRSITEKQYLDGFNDGYDACFAEYVSIS